MSMETPSTTLTIRQMLSRPSITRQGVTFARYSSSAQIRELPIS